jgi:tetratricopeptide (TPR) repeat protein
MNERVNDRENRAASADEAYRHAAAIVALGEAKTAVDVMRREVSRARASLPEASPALLRVLSRYADILESTDALAEAEFIRAEALEIVVSAELTTQDAVEALLGYGLLLCKVHNYDGALARLKETVQRAETLDGIDELDRQIVLAQAWRGQAQAFEALGEFSEASNALDVFMSVKRSIRFIAFAPSRGR